MFDRAARPKLDVGTALPVIRRSQVGARRRRHRDELSAWSKYAHRRGGVIARPPTRNPGPCQLPRRFFLASTTAMVASAIVMVARKIVMGSPPSSDDPADGVHGRQGRNGSGIRTDPLFVAAVSGSAAPAAASACRLPQADVTARRSRLLPFDDLLVVIEQLAVGAVGELDLAPAAVVAGPAGGGQSRGGEEQLRVLAARPGGP
jgi:hypothetical protein